MMDRTLFVGDERGRVFSWSVGNKPGRGMVDHWVIMIMMMMMMIMIIMMMMMIMLQVRDDTQQECQDCRVRCEPNNYLG